MAAECIRLQRLPGVRARRGVEGMGQTTRKSVRAAGAGELGVADSAVPAGRPNRTTAGVILAARSAPGPTPLPPGRGAALPTDPSTCASPVPADSARGRAPTGPATIPCSPELVLRKWKGLL